MSVNQLPGDNLSDKILITNVLNGSPSAFGQIIHHTEGLVTQILFKMIPNAEDRKDIAQDVYLKAFHSLGGFKFQSRLSTWIARIAYNACLSWLEKKKLVFPGDEDVLSERGPEAGNVLTIDTSHGEWKSIFLQKELAIILQLEINKLSPVYRTLITLYHQEDLSYDEIGQITGLPDGTVKNYLFRARKKLKESLLAQYKKEEL